MSAQVKTPDPAAVLATLTALLGEVIGDDVTIVGPVTMATSFNADLELESIEMVALAERLQAHYGARVDFVGWIAQKELDEIIALRVGDLVGFIVAALDEG
jgi:acyl carrier protein